MVEIISEGTNLAEVKLDNSRHPEQLQKMLELARTGQCHFCREGFETRHAAPIIYEEDNWFIAANNFPYDGSVHHYLIIPKIHVTRTRELDTQSRIELFDAQYWLEEHLHLKGSSLISASALLVRSGDMSLTCATLDHLHFHLIVGAKKIGTGKNKIEDIIIAPVGFKKKEKKK